MKNAKQKQDDFECWLMEMDDALARFLEGLPDDVRARLDYSEDSLDALEGWVLARYGSPEALLDASAKESLDGVSRYVGETSRRQIGGRWEIRLDDPSYAYYALPELTGYSERSTPICPYAMALSSTDRRTGSYFRTVLRNVKKRINR